MAKKYRRLANRPVATAGSPPNRNEFNPDYTGVKKDLRRIGALAAFFILVLVALSFFLR